MANNTTRPYRILVVCTGNICRSAMAEVVLRERLKEEGLSPLVQVGSAGVSDEEAGHPIDSRARLVLQEAGYQIGSHTARQVSPQDLAQNQLILAMTRSHLTALKKIAQVVGGDESRIHLWNEFDSAAEGPDVADPYYGSREGFWNTLAAIERGTAGVITYLKTQLGKED